MTTFTLQPSPPKHHELARWLVAKSSDPARSAQWDYHLLGRVSLLGTSLGFMAEAVSRAVLACIALIATIITLGAWKMAKRVALEQKRQGCQAASTSWASLRAIGAPKEFFQNFLDETKSVRLAELNKMQLVTTGPLRVQKGAALIAGKLRHQVQRAQNQAAHEAPKAFNYLVSPKDFPAKSHTEIVSDYEVGVCHYIGRRPEMEDEHVATSFHLQVGKKRVPVQLFGIFDGHGGEEASQYMREKLEIKLHETMDTFCSHGINDEAIWNALKITFSQLDIEFKKQHPGTTATVAMILENKVWTANVGDSRIIADNGVQMTEDAKPTDPYYYKGIRKAKGFVWGGRVNGILAVARAIGDHRVGAVIARPKIYQYPLPTGSDPIVIGAACDGIYDVANTQQIARAIRAQKNNRSPEQLAKDIVYSAYEAGSTDNLSMLIIKRKKS
jgi:serine/threonine protein phosphatase PrpC